MSSQPAEQIPLRDGPVGPDSPPMTDSPRIHTLEGVVACCNLEFGRRLLATGRHERFDFSPFVRVADELVDHDPRRAAIHLAGLIALDVASEPDPGRRPSGPHREAGRAGRRRPDRLERR